ncbi:MAG TPA: response regulator [Bryobacteraceae bacterium]|nr:response regulator [Bryobacteraceae bacterium]
MTAVEILLVEDNAGDALLIQQVLAGCPVRLKLHVARDGEQALGMLANRGFKPDLIILDLNIPRISGMALLERWGRVSVPVVVFTSSLEERKRALELGACAFVLKPVNFDAFTDAVRGIVQEWGLPRASQTAV